MLLAYRFCWKQSCDGRQLHARLGYAASGNARGASFREDGDANCHVSVRGHQFWRSGGEESAFCVDFLFFPHSFRSQLKSAATWAEKGPNIYYMTQTIAEEDNILPDSMEMEVGEGEQSLLCLFTDLFLTKDDGLCGHRSRAQLGRARSIHQVCVSVQNERVAVAGE